jgi:hypothetical protein
VEIKLHFRTLETVFLLRLISHVGTHLLCYSFINHWVANYENKGFL